jgi:hypothetical protein
MSFVLPCIAACSDLQFIKPCVIVTAYGQWYLKKMELVGEQGLCTICEEPLYHRHVSSYVQSCGPCLVDVHTLWS